MAAPSNSTLDSSSQYDNLNILSHYSSSFVYKLCGGLQLVSGGEAQCSYWLYLDIQCRYHAGVLMAVTLLVYPSSWTNPEMETVCGQGV